jgi:hypothetical protein
MRHDDVEVAGGQGWDLQPAVHGDPETSKFDGVPVNRHDASFPAEPMQPSAFCIGVD